MTKRLGIREVARQVRYAVRVGLVPAGDPAEAVLRSKADEEDDGAVFVDAVGEVVQGEDLNLTWLELAMITGHD